MKVLGVMPSSKDVSWALLVGTRSAPTISNLESNKQKFPSGQAEELTLKNLYQFASVLLPQIQADKVCILKAGNNRFGATSAMRPKAEAMFQLACAEKNIPVELITPQSLRSQEKKFDSETGGTPEEILNSGNEFKPKTWKDSVITAWIGLD